MSFARFGSTFGPIGAALGVAAGVAFTAAQIAAIQSQQYSGRATGGLVQKGGAYVVGENGPEAFIPNQTGTIIPNRNMGGNGSTNVNFTINAVDAKGIDQVLVSRRGLITSIIREASETNGVRSTF
jgi:SLT domain-containing protein